MPTFDFATKNFIRRFMRAALSATPAALTAISRLRPCCRIAFTNIAAVREEKSGGEASALHGLAGLVRLRPSADNTTSWPHTCSSKQPGRNRSEEHTSD